MFWSLHQVALGLGTGRRCDRGLSWGRVGATRAAVFILRAPGSTEVLQRVEDGDAWLQQGARCSVWLLTLGHTTGGAAVLIRVHFNPCPCPLSLKCFSCGGYFWRLQLTSPVLHVHLMETQPCPTGKVTAPSTLVVSGRFQHGVVRPGGCCQRSPQLVGPTPCIWVPWH